MILENSFGKEMMMAKIQCMAKVTEVSVLAEGIVERVGIEPTYAATNCNYWF